MINQLKFFSEFFDGKVKIGVFEEKTLMFNKQDLIDLFSLKYRRTIIPSLLKTQANKVINPEDNKKYKGTSTYITLKGITVLLHKDLNNTKEFFDLEEILFEIYFRAKFGISNVEKTVYDYIENENKIQKENQNQNENENENQNETIGEEKLIENQEKNKEETISENDDETKMECDSIDLKNDEILLMEVDEKDQVNDENEKNLYKNEKLFIIAKLSENTLLIKKKSSSNILKLKNKYNIVFAHQEDLYKIILEINEAHFQLFNHRLIKQYEEDVIILKSSLTFENNIKPYLIQMGLVNQV